MALTRTVPGYTDLGRSRIPALPVGIVLTDRGDGTLWLLSHNSSATSETGIGRFAIRDTWDISFIATRTYPANEGPRLSSNPQLRLLVRGSRLGYEDVTLGQGVTDINNQRLMSRHSTKNETREVYVPSGWVAGAGLAWKDVSLTL